MLNSLQMTILMGPTIPVPLPLSVTEAVRSIEVTHNDSSRSGFQIEFTVGRTQGLFGVSDYPLLNDPQVQPFNRVIIIVTHNAIPTMLMDGIITHVQLLPSNDPAGSRYIVTGEDISVLMDMEEKVIPYPGQSELMIAGAILAQYAVFNIIPMVMPPPIIDIPLPTDRIPTQCGTDLNYLQEMAARFNYDFYVSTGPVPFVNTAYWGPPKWLDIPQAALSVNMGPATNVKSINFNTNAIAPVIVTGEVQDRLSGQALPLAAFVNTLPPLASNQLSFRPRTVMPKDIDGMNYQQAYAKAQAMVNDSWQRAVTATGEVDTAEYGNILQARSLVGVRGAGATYDGFYYVQSVTHRIQVGSYTQSFNLTRQGLGSTTPLVVP